MFECVSECVFVCVHLCVFMYVFACVCEWVRVCVCSCVCVCEAYMRVCVCSCLRVFESVWVWQIKTLVASIGTNLRPPSVTIERKVWEIRPKLDLVFLMTITRRKNDGTRFWFEPVSCLDNLYLDRSLSISVMVPSHCCTVKQTYLPAIHRCLN